ncbi:MAG TPA: AsmA family protein, partial [Candidatus Angelobacter sp.]|nr:AsmA family protein [Candidatus Angelobacter sp.]
RLASAFGVAFGKGMDVNGRLSADIQARGAAGSPAMNGHLSIHDLAISGKELAQPVKAGDVELTLTPDTIHSNDFTATTGATSVTVNLVLSQYTGSNSAINATLRMPNARINEVLNIAKAYGVAAAEGMSGDGMLELDVRVQGPTKDMSALSFSGTGKIQNATLKTPEFTQPVKIGNADIVFSQNSATLKNLSATVGQTNATGSMTLKNFAAPQVQFALNADKINVAELQQIFSAAPGKRASADHSFWDVVPSANAQTGASSSATSKMTGGGTITVGTVLYDDLTITNAHSTVSFDRGLIQLNPTTATLYGGSESGNVTIDMRPAQPVYTVNMKTDKVDANKLLSSVSSLKKTLYGMLASNVDATFSSTSADSIARSLNGSVSLNLTNGRMMGLDLLNELATVGQFLGRGPSGPQGFTDLVQLTGNFDVKNGVAQTTNLKAVISGGTFAAIGSVDLASQSLNMHVTAVLNKTMSQQVGSTQVGGYMNTALANSQGELVLPVIVTGTFQHPQVVPDVRQIAQMKLQNLLPTSKNPGALTSGIVGAIFGQDQGGANGKQKGGVSGFIDALGGKQQGNQPAGNQPAGNQPPNANQGQPQSSPLGDLFKQLMDKKNKQQQQQNPPPPKKAPQ